MKTTGSLEEGIADVRPGGLIKNRKIVGMKMDNVNWHGARIHNTDLGGLSLIDCNLSNMVISDDCVIDGVMVGNVPLAEAVELYRKHHPTFEDLDDADWPDELL